ncbi:MAG: hypothetical protein JWR67_3646 [Mucilaginibacter sp.]|nr:hypothetical protein [Mucilaginibacter sp.]
MIIPENDLPPDDMEASDADDQKSQQDVHSNGFDNTAQTQDDGLSDADRLRQALDAAEPSYTLDPDKGVEPDNKNDEKDYNIKQ